MAPAVGTHGCASPPNTAVTHLESGCRHTAAGTESRQRSVAVLRSCTPLGPHQWLGGADTEGATSTTLACMGAHPWHPQGHYPPSPRTHGQPWPYSCEPHRRCRTVGFTRELRRVSVTRFHDAGRPAAALDLDWRKSDRTWMASLLSATAPGVDGHATEEPTRERHASVTGASGRADMRGLPPTWNLPRSEEGSYVLDPSPRRFEKDGWSDIPAGRRRGEGGWQKRSTSVPDTWCPRARCYRGPCRHTCFTPRPPCQKRLPSQADEGLVKRSHTSPPRASSPGCIC